MNKMREDFEKVYVTDMNDFYFSNEQDKLVYLKKNENGEYVHNCTKEAWYWWCKSRESVVVELSNKLPYNQTDLDFKRIYAAGFNDALKSCMDRIEESGIKIKEV
jgi:hypothetical protein